MARQNAALSKTMEKLDTQLNFLVLIKEGHTNTQAWALVFGDEYEYNEVAANKLLKNKPLNRMADRVYKLKSLEIIEDNPVKKSIIEELLSRIPLATDNDAVRLCHEIALLTNLYESNNKNSQVEIFFNDLLPKKDKKDEKDKKASGTNPPKKTK